MRTTVRKVSQMGSGALSLLSEEQGRRKIRDFFLRTTYSSISVCGMLSSFTSSAHDRHIPFLRLPLTLRNCSTKVPRSEHCNRRDHSCPDGPEKKMLHYTRLGRNMGLGDAYVKKVFDSVASKYDMMNDVLSLGIHRFWKKHLVEDCVCPLAGGKFLDVAGGTGDIAFRITDSIRAREQSFGLVPKALDGTKVVVCDINEMMLKEGQKRAEREGYMDIDWVCASGEELPFEDGVFDSYTVSFGIRNFSDRPKALCEAFRVLKIGGVMNVLEFSKVTCPLLSVPYDLWSYGFVPQAGRILADEESYRYLVDSIRAFPNQEEFAQMIRDAGFGYVRYENLTGGIACIHTAVKTTPTTVNLKTSSDIPASKSSEESSEAKPEADGA